jgi:hypothetical protein
MMGNLKTIVQNKQKGIDNILTQWQQPSDRGTEGDRVISLKEQLELMNRSNSNQ